MVLSEDPREETMVNRTLKTAAFLIAAATPALAENQTWNITEVTESVGGPEGQWSVSVDGGGKITGHANMQTGTGAVVTYNVDGSIKGTEFTVNMSDRSDGKKGCVANGQSTLNEDQKSHRVIGKVQCDGNVKFYIRGGY
jgi:hypothetical protein